MSNDVIGLRIEDSLLRRLLERMRQRSGNFAPAMRGAAGVMLDGVEQAFADEADPTTGAPWAKLKASTIADREKTGNWPGKILQRSGQLAASYTADSGPDFAVVGTNKVQAAMHQFGGKTKPHVIKPKNKKALAFGGKVVGKVNHPGSKIPARPALGLSEESREEIAEIFERHLLDN